MIVHKALERDIQSFALSIAANEHEANDLIQYAWEKSLSYKELHEWPYYKQKAWFYRVMKNELIDLRRKHRREIGLDETKEPVFFPTEFNNLEIIELLNKLPPKQKDLVFKRYWLGLSSTEIGKSLNIPSGTVRYQLTKAIGFLRQLIQEAYE
ncbi:MULTISPECIES: RNA polymerase sigma factor [Bacillaceae]|uniref:Uncharacterized protein n=1 Tax=Alkalicoccobacillus plakortidis TaxID=444060 RepID=A0A9D5DMA5_9BACI|nr:MULTISPECIES: RNA polymerase sigma factor [Bacillaceae]KQL56614.1 hypothetical protein AN965_12915 [Alkalicoccobacillus plakortidis]